MKKFFLIGSLIIVLALGLASLAYAQSPTPPTPQTPYGSGMGYGRMGPGGMWGQNGTAQFSPMHEYMEEAMAEALGIEKEDLEAALAEGKTMWQLAEEKGISFEKFQTLMLDARKLALQKMVGDNLLTQEQADWMLSHMQGRWGQGGYSNGGCPGMGGGYGRSGGRWSNPGVAPSSNPTSTGL